MITATLPQLQNPQIPSRVMNLAVRAILSMLACLPSGNVEHDLLDRDNVAVGSVGRNYDGAPALYAKHSTGQDDV